MKLFNGMDEIRKLPEGKQAAFRKFKSWQKKARLLPLFLDVHVFLLMVAFSIRLLEVFELSKQPGYPNWLVNAILSLLLALFSILVVNRLLYFRLLSPFLVYIYTISLIAFGGVVFVLSAGDVGGFRAAMEMIPTIGVLTLSYWHSLIIYCLCILGLSMASVAIDNYALIEKVPEMILLTCVGFTLVIFNRWFFDNILAFQFLLKDRKKQLEHAAELLDSAEKRLVKTQKDQALNHMASGLMHEIINPLNCANQAIGYAKSINTDPRIDKKLHDVLEKQHKVSQSIQDLRRFTTSNINQGAEKINVAELIDKTLRFCSEKLDNIHVEFDVRYVNDNIYCFPSELAQSIINVLLNAAEAIDKKFHGAQGGVIIISVVAEADTISIQIEDNGIGISEAQLQKITQPFYSLNDREDCVGLGLSICQTIMRHHGGEMQISSQEGESTTVRFVLPQGEDSVMYHRHTQYYGQRTE